jgi:PAS domain S-box-containing protein
MLTGVMELWLPDRAQSAWANARLVASLAALLLAAACLASALSAASPDELLLVLLVPVALVAFRFEVAAGIGAGVAALSIVVTWDVVAHGTIRPLAFVRPMVVLGALGLLAALALAQRKRLEETLTSYNDLSLDLHCMTSFDGYFTRLNPSFTRLLGFSREELMRAPLYDFVHPDDRASTAAAIVQQIEEGSPVFHFHNRYRTKTGEYRWLEWTSRPDASRRELIAVARDVTERVRLERAASEQTALLEAAVEARTEELQRRNDELEEARLETLRRLALAAEYRDDETHHHTERVGHTAALIADAIGLPAKTVERLRLAAPLHDIGKLALPDAILLKPGMLTPEEFRIMQTHTHAGARLLSGSGSDVLRLAEEIALTHHERWDGSGYPGGLGGEQIPISGRIVAIADVFDALTHARPYKPAWSAAQAAAEINSLSGQQFDPTLVAAFNTLDHARLVGGADEPALAVA